MHTLPKLSLLRDQDVCSSLLSVSDLTFINGLYHSKTFDTVKPGVSKLFGKRKKFTIAEPMHTEIS